MSIKKYKVTAQLNWDASNYKSVEVKAKRPENAQKQLFKNSKNCIIQI